MVSTSGIDRYCRRELGLATKRLTKNVSFRKKYVFLSAIIFGKINEGVVVNLCIKFGDSWTSSSISAKNFFFKMATAAERKQLMTSLFQPNLSEGL